METEQRSQAKNTRVIQQNGDNTGSIRIVDNRANGIRKNETGLPDNLKAGVESLSGFSLDNVRVHYNSSKPATVQALAYTQGTDIHVAPGQEKHLPHEAWHVAQQMAGRVAPTTSVNGMPVNDNAALEHEADVMGAKAAQRKIDNNRSALNDGAASHNGQTIQRFPKEYVHIVTGGRIWELFKEGKRPNVFSSLNKNGLQNIRGLQDEASKPGAGFEISEEASNEVSSIHVPANSHNQESRSSTTVIDHSTMVFMWDKTGRGKDGAKRLIEEIDENEKQSPIVFRIRIRIRFRDLERNMLGDGPGAWGYEGNIPRQYIFIEGLDSRSDPGYFSWLIGSGWRFDHSNIKESDANSLDQELNAQLHNPSPTKDSKIVLY